MRGGRTDVSTGGEEEVGGEVLHSEDEEVEVEGQDEGGRSTGEAEAELSTRASGRNGTGD